MEELAGIAEF
jgi:hypothetical protein